MTKNYYNDQILLKKLTILFYWYYRWIQKVYYIPLSKLLLTEPGGPYRIQVLLRWVISLLPILQAEEACRKLYRICY